MSLNIETRKGPPQRLMLIAAAMQARKTPTRARPAAAPKPKKPCTRDRSHNAADKGLCVEQCRAKSRDTIAAKRAARKTAP